MRLRGGAAVTGTAALLRALPRRLALGCGRALGRLWGDLDRRHVALAVEHLARALPHWDEGRRWRTARGVYAHFGQVTADLLWLAGRGTRLMAASTFEGEEHVRAAAERGRGTLLVTAHVGNWEAHGVAHGLRFGPIAVVARPLDDPALDARLNAFRGEGGNQVVPKRHALGEVLRRLRAGGVVALLVDQNMPPGDGVFAEFFGRPAATTTVAAALALKTGCALVPCRSRLEPDGRYLFTYEPALEVPASGDRSADLHRVTQALTARIEDWVRQTPEQWLWIHRRWRTQPAEAPS